MKRSLVALTLCAVVLTGASSVGAASSEPKVTAKSDRAWGQTRDEGLTVRVNRLGCSEDEVAVMTLQISGLTTKRITSAPGCDFLDRLDRAATPDGGKPYAPWRGWRVWLSDYNADECEDPNWQSRDLYLPPCADLNIVRSVSVDEAQVLKWSVAAHGVVVGSGAARFARVVHRKSRPGKKLRWVRGISKSLDIWDAPDGWWKCRQDGRFWRRPVFVNGSLYAYTDYCRTPRRPTQYKTSVTVLSWPSGK